MPELFTGETMTTAMSPSAPAVAPEASPASDPTTVAAGVDPAADAASPSQAAVDGVSATTDPTQTTPDPTAPPEKHWPKILNNARTKAVAETEAKYTWASQIPEQHRATVGEFYKTLDTDPAMAIEALIATAAGDPKHAPKLRSLLGKLLGNRITQDPAAPAANTAGAIPEPDFQDEHGHTFYSADRIKALVESIEARIDAKYAKELTPLKTDLQTRDLHARQVNAKRQADAWADERYEKVSQWPHFKAHEAAIAQAITDNPDLDVGDAYIQIVVPQLSFLERKAVVATQQDKANAGSLNPSTPASAVAARPTSFREAFEQLPASAWTKTG